jgi:branched-chain amino acid transport system permease protein
MTLITLNTILLSGLLLGALYALISTGLSMVWSTLRMFNFAYGSLVTLGAYIAWTAIEPTQFGIPIGIGIAIAVVMLFGIGMLLERILISPFAKRPDASLIVMITTLAGSIFIENGIQIIWGPRMKQLPTLVTGKIQILGTSISTTEFIMLLGAPTILILLTLLLKYTKIGLAIRGVEQNRDLALLTGVNVSRIYSITFGISAGLAAAAGIMLGSTRIISPTMGSTPLIKGFIVVILGGLGSMGGTMIGAFVIGMIEAISTSFLGLYWTPAVLFGVMILTLIVKPTGLFGEK